MPVIRDIPLSWKPKEVLRRAGFKRHSEIRSEIKSLVPELLASVENARLLEPPAPEVRIPVTLTL